MVRKLSAFGLVLALCLSAVFLPANAAGFDPSYSFAEGINTAFKVELDQEYYNPGDTVTISIYARFADESRETKGGTLMLGVDSTQFDVSDNFNAEINTGKANATWESYWLTPDKTAFAWQTNPNLISRILGACTTDAGRYDTLLKIAMAQDNDKALDLTHGLSTADLNADPDPLLTFQLKLRDDVAPGSEIKIGIPTGAVVGTPAQVTMQFFSNPGVSSVARADAASTYDITEAAPKASIASPAPAGPVVTKTQAEVKMTLNAEQTAVDYAAAPFQFRVISSISEDDWNTYFNGDGSNIESVGFVAYKGDGAFDMETAKSVAMGSSAADYQAAKTDYIQKVEGQAANFGARIDFTARANVKDVTYIAFVQYDTDQFAFYDTSFDADLNSNYDDIVSQYAGFIAG